MATKKTNTRTKRAAVKPAAKKKTSLPPKKLSNVIALSRHSLTTLWDHKKQFAGVVAVYAALNIIFVSGLGFGVNVSKLSENFFEAYRQLLKAATNAPDAAGVYQLFLALFVSLALIWSLRQVYAGHQTRIRDAYYKGMYPLIPYILVLFVVLLQLLPMVIGTSLYQQVVSSVSTSPIELIAWLVVAIAASLISAYWIAASLLALIIVTLPDMAPVKALKLASELVKGRRWKVLRKLVFLPVVLLLIATVVILPLVAAVPIVAPWVLMLLGPALIAIGHSYVYTLYRELMGD